MFFWPGIISQVEIVHFENALRRSVPAPGRPVLTNHPSHSLGHCTKIPSHWTTGLLPREPWKLQSQNGLSQTAFSILWWLGPEYKRLSQSIFKGCLGFEFIRLMTRLKIVTPPDSINKYNPFYFFPQLCWWLSGSEPMPVQKLQIRSLGWGDPLKTELQPTPVFLPGKSHGQRSLAGYSPWGRKRVRHDLGLNNNSSSIWLRNVKNSKSGVCG